MKEPLTLIAHRGYSDRFPENTLLAFEEAITAGAGLLECDAHLSLDRRVVVIHDPDLKRTTGEKGIVSQLTLDQIRQFSAGYPERFGEQFRDCRVPGLEEVLDLVRGRARLFIEIKPEAVEEKKPAPIVSSVLRILKDREMLKEVAVISFHRGALRQCREESAEVRTGILFHTWPLKSPLKMAHEIGANFVIFNKRLMVKRYVSRLRNGLLPIGAYTIDDPAEVDRLYDVGVRAIATNRILEMAEALRRAGWDQALDLAGRQIFGG